VKKPAHDYIAPTTFSSPPVVRRERFRDVFVATGLKGLIYGTNSLVTLRATLVFVLLQSGIVNRYQLLCNAQTVLELNRGTAALVLFYSLSFFSTFSFYIFIALTILLLFLGASLVCVNNLKRTADLAL